MRKANEVIRCRPGYLNWGRHWLIVKDHITQKGDVVLFYGPFELMGCPVTLRIVHESFR
jgi:hypothetical protein